MLGLKVAQERPLQNMWYEGSKFPFIRVSEECRKSGKKAPSLVSVGVHNFAVFHRPAFSELPEQDFQGTTFGVKELFHIWNFLRDLSDATTVTSEDLIDEGVIDTECSWFTCDLTLLQKEKNEPVSGTRFPQREDLDQNQSESPSALLSWYSRLMSVSLTVLDNIIQTKLDFLDVNGKKPLTHPQWIQRLLMRVPTPPCPNKDLNHFPGLEGDFEEWIEFYEQEDLREIRHPDPAEDIMEEWQSERVSPFINAGELEQFLESKSPIPTSTDLAERYFNKDPPATTLFNTKDFPDIIQIAPAATQRPQLSKYEEMLLNASVFGQAQLIQYRLTKEIERMNFVQQYIADAKSSVERQKKILEQVLSAYENSYNMTTLGFYECKKEKNELTDLQQRQEHVDPVILEYSVPKYLRFSSSKMPVRPSKVGQSPYHSPVVP